VTLRRTRAGTRRPPASANVRRPGNAAARHDGSQGKPIALPVLVAPARNAGRFIPTRSSPLAACAERRHDMTVSSGSTFTLEEISARATGPLWFQQYLFSDGSLHVRYGRPTASCRYKPLCITVDAAIPPKRERSIRTPSPSHAGELQELQARRAPQVANADAAPSVLNLIAQAIPEAWPSWLLTPNYDRGQRGPTLKKREDAIANGGSAVVVRESRRLQLTRPSLHRGIAEIAQQSGTPKCTWTAESARGGGHREGAELGRERCSSGRPVFSGASPWTGRAGVRTCRTPSRGTALDWPCPASSP